MHRTPSERALTNEERRLVFWMLTHADADVATLVPQIEAARVVGHCPCGCASIDFLTATLPDGSPRPNMRVVADYLYGDEQTLSGAFVFARGDLLGGLEVYGLAGDNPTTLPAPEELRPFVSSDGRRP